MNALDTNIWIYLHDTRDPWKHQKAQEVYALVDALVLPWQVGCEFIAASKKLAPLGFSQDRAWQELSDMRASADLIALPDPVDWDLARDLQRREMLSFWDALLLATCMRCGVNTLHTEDIGSPRIIRGLELRNPFLAPSP